MARNQFQRCWSALPFSYSFQFSLSRSSSTGQYLLLLMIDHNENVETNDENFLDAIASSMVCTKIQPGDILAGHILG